MLPHEHVPAELLAAAGAETSAAEAAAAAAGAEALDCLEACCLHDDLHLFRCVGWRQGMGGWQAQAEHGVQRPESLPQRPALQGPSRGCHRYLLETG